MAIDRFSMCPGGTGKKIKFCHGDCVGFLEKVQKLMDGGQIRAALQLVDQTLSKDPSRSCVWSYKCLLERAVGNVDQFVKAADEYSQRFPKSPVALAELSLSHLFRGQFSNAIDSLGQSLIASEEQKIIYVRQTAAAATLSEALIKFGHIPPAVEILMLFQNVSHNGQTSVQELLGQVIASQEIPLELREAQWDGLFMDEKYQQLLEVTDRLAVRLRWRDLEKYLRDYLSSNPEDARVWHFLGVTLMWLMEPQEAATAFTRAGELEKNDRLAVFSLYRSFLVTGALGDEENSYDVEVIVDEPDRLKEAVLSDRLVFSQRPEHGQPLPWYFPDDVGEEITPELILAVLRRSIGGDGSQNGRVFSEPGKTPLIAFGSFYGRQTDRPARLLFAGVYESDLERLKEMVKGWLGREDVEWSIKPGSDESSRFIRLALDGEVIAGFDRSIDLKEEWKIPIFEWLPNMTFPALGGLSLKEAANDPQKRRWALAILKYIDYRILNTTITGYLDELRQQLGLGFADDLDVDIKRFRRIPLSLVKVLDLTRLNIETLTQFFNLALVYRESTLIYELASEIVRRRDEDGVPAALVRTAYLGTIDEALNLGIDDDQIKRLAEEGLPFLEKHNLPHGGLHVRQFRMAFSHGNSEEAKPLLDHMFREHKDEADVMEFLRQFVSLLGYFEQLAQQEGQSPTAGRPSGGGIWTPDSEAGRPGSSKKLWVPGSD